MTLHPCSLSSANRNIRLEVLMAVEVDITWDHYLLELSSVQPTL